MVQVKERQGCRGIFSFQVRDAGGEIVRESSRHNHIVSGAKAVMAHLVGGDFDGFAVTQIACGTSGTAPDDTDTGITGAYSKAVASVSFPQDDCVQFDWHLGNSENNGNAIREFGLLTEDDVLFARFVLEEPIPKTSQFSVDVQWVIAFNNDEEAGTNG
jgi:hypothetical protein